MLNLPVIVYFAFHLLKAMANKKQTAQIELIKIDLLEENEGQLAGLPSNPREIADEKYELLKEDIQKYPEFLNINALKVYPLDNGHYIVIGGNMRFRALRELGYEEVPCICIPKDTSTEDLKAYILIDNNNFGDWNWSLLEEWPDDLLMKCGLDIPDDWDSLQSEQSQVKPDDGPYSRKVVTPIYEPTGEVPTFSEMCNTSKCDQLKDEINNAEIPDDIKKFLCNAACRHMVFNYEKIASYYAQAPANIQDLMEKSALVIIDYDKAIENGFITLTKDLANLYRSERHVFNEAELTEADIIDYDEE